MARKMKKTEATKAVIYLRVSTDRQATEGDGLQSQLHSCERYAASRGLQVVKVFKDEGVSGGLLPSLRPGASAMFAYLDTQKEEHLVIADHPSRFARDQRAWLEFVTRFQLSKATPASPNHVFGEQPENMLMTDMVMAMASYYRVANTQQVINRQEARLLQGFWVFAAPPGLKFVKSSSGGGKILVHDQPIATAVAEAFEGLACGRFETQADVARFLTETGVFDKKVHISRVKAMMTNILYAGYIEYPKWDIERIPARHEGIISLDIFWRVQERLGLKAKAPYRKDINGDFPLRGWVLCACCGEPLTGAWTTSRSKVRHPYYRCKKFGCPEYGKSLRRADVEGRLEDILKSMTPSAPILAALRGIVEDCWNEKRKSHDLRMKNANEQVGNITTDLRSLMDRCLRTDDPDMIEAYENRIKELKQQRLGIEASIAGAAQTDLTFETAIGTAIDFVSDPFGMWSNGDVEEKRMILRAAFTQQLAFEKEKGFGTAGKSLPFTVLEGLRPLETEMVAYYKQ